MQYARNITAYIKQKLRPLKYMIYDAIGKHFVECPFCRWRGKEFKDFGYVSRKNAQCPKCGSLERHRLYYLYLRKTLNTGRKISLLHFAPERILEDLFRSYSNIDYLSVDIEEGRAMKVEDITSVKLADDSFDVIMCSHVLEHIVDDKKAMRELYRILKQGGFAIIQVPIKDELERTFEDKSITDPKDRLIYFGQEDHVRVYAIDFKDRLEVAGFKVTIDKYYDSIETNIIKKYGLRPEDIYYCSK